MPYCSRCGIEVDKYVKSCPLCHAPIQVLDEDTHAEKKFPIKNISSMGTAMSKKQKRNLIWGIISLLLFIPMFVILTIRFLYSKDFTWEGYTLVPLVAGWIYISFLLFFFKKVKVIFASFYVITNLFLLSMDLIDSGLSWYLNMGLPISSLFSVLLILIIFVSQKARRKGANIAAFILIGICLFCIGIESFINLSRGEVVFLRWSLIVCGALVPISLFLLYLHYVLKTHFDWEKKFYT